MSFNFNEIEKCLSYVHRHITPDLDDRAVTEKTIKLIPNRSFTARIISYKDEEYRADTKVDIYISVDITALANREEDAVKVVVELGYGTIIHEWTKGDPGFVLSEDCCGTFDAVYTLVCRTVDALKERVAAWRKEHRSVEKED